MSLNKRVTLSHFLMEEQRRYGGTGVFTALMTDILTACKMVAHEVNRGALLGNLGVAGSENVQGEDQKKLDVIANDIFLYMNSQGGYYAAMASEELEHISKVENNVIGRYLLLFDPLDGSSNIDVNISVGSIFSILKSPDGVDPNTEDAFLQPGVKQVAAGYAIYGASTMLVLTTGHGVNAFTLDNDVGMFFLTHRNMQVPVEAAEFAINASRERFWEPPIQRYINECRAGKSGPRGRNHNMRWVASMVAEVHRILCRGGVFMYPLDEDIREKGGKLRLLYEANPMSFIIEQAGGAASTGRQRIMEVQPTSLHQQIPVILGSKAEVDRIVSYHEEFDRGELTSL